MGNQWVVEDEGWVGAGVVVSPYTIYRYCQWGQAKDIVQVQDFMDGDKPAQKLQGMRQWLIALSHVAIDYIGQRTRK